MATKTLELDVLFNETTENSNVGSFTLKPLERGYGTTIGNALRRVLLTSIPGAAITHLKIEGSLGFSKGLVRKYIKHHRLPYGT